ALCTGQTITLTANGATTYTWSTNSNLGSIAVAPTSNITYSLSGTSAAGCVGSTGATQAVTVYSLPVVSITGTNALCSGQSINLTASGANTYTWSTSSNLSSISVAPLSNITYTLNGTSTAGCISAAAASLAVTVNTLPVVSISGTNALCTGQTITLTAIGATSYSWNHGPLTATCAVNPISNSSFVVTGKTSLGCTSAPATIAISVFSLPIVSINGASTLCAGDNLTLTANGANTYTWFNGSNTSSLLLSPPSNTFFTLNGTSSNGCQNLNTSTLSVSVFNRPNITITGTNALCSGQTINLTANGANSYTWSTGSNFNSITISPTINTTYSVSGTNTLGCTSNSLAVLAVNVYSLPIVSIAGTNTICFGQLAQLTAAGANSYTWSNGANTNSINVSPIANFTYGVIGSNLNGCLSPTVVQSISVYSLPIIIASASSPSICSGGSVTLNATGASSYTWNISPFNPITISPVNTATYTVAGTSPLGCLSQNTAAVSVSVFVTPSVSAGISNSLVCFGRLVSLQANGAASYTWNPSQLTNVPFTATSSAQYTLTGSSIAGCTNTNLATVNLSVMSLPNVQIFGDSAFCFGTTSTLSANGANTYTWNTGSNLNSISITPSITSTYTLIGTALNTCSNTAVKQITVFPLPTVSASISKSVICFGDTVMLSGSGANTYSWTGGAGSGGTLIPTATSSYSLTGYSISGCSSTNVAVVSVTVNSLPIITTGISNPSVCLGQTTSIYANGANSYTWSNGVLNGVAFIPTASAVFTVIGTDANGCTNLAIQNITVHPVPNLSIAASSYSVCEGKQVTLIGQGANTFTWSSGISNGVAFTPSVTSSYTLNGSFNTGCSNTISPVVTVSVFGLPDITISTEKPGICPADSTELFYTGAETYTWIPPLGPGNFIKPKISTSYTVFGTDLWGCQNTSSVLITVHPLPTLQISSTNSMACIGEQVTLKATGAQTYTWNASLVNSEYLFTATTNTQFTLYGSNVFGCLDTTSYNQNIQSCSVALLADLSKSDVSCESRNDASIQVNSTIQPRIPTTQYRIKYKWLGTNQCTSEECTTLNALAKGNYTLLMIVTSTVNAHYQKTDTLVKTITINDQTPPCNLQPYHGITADFNATNDYFHIDNIDVYPNNSVEIYNRWGERIKRIPYYNNTTNIWPTPDEIGDLQSGTYFYIIFTGDPRVNNLRGWIELLK
ncbi:MAG: gliding motility-associated C-terminal domain-containing protein, partial [Bacteroidota bacterium]